MTITRLDQLLDREASRAVKRYDLENVGKRWEQLLARLTEH